MSLIGDGCTIIPVQPGIPGFGRSKFGESRVGVMAELGHRSVLGDFYSFGVGFCLHLHRLVVVFAQSIDGEVAILAGSVNSLIHCFF